MSNRILRREFSAICAHLVPQGPALVADHKKAVRLRKDGGPGVLRTAPWAAGAMVVGLTVSAALAADPENCLTCHRYPGLARMQNGRVDLYHVDSDYYDRALGPHARLRCTDCHEHSEVSVVPHRPVSPVDCTRTCHLSDPARPEIRFSHSGVADALDLSVHNSAVLERSNELLGRPVKDGQSRCLLCHSEPLFRQDDRPGMMQLQNAPVDRCNTCHTGLLAIDSSYAYQHVRARSRPARTHMDLTRMCAICHTDARVRNAYSLPDSIASYLFSFHGKGMQLGSEATAGCLDCHVGPLDNAHAMRSRKDAEAPTNPSQLANTCRSPACHPTAGVRITTAAVHLDLSAGQGIEYLIGVLFILLIVSTFGPSALLQVLEMLQIVIGRTDPQHHERRVLAERMLATSAGRAALSRFTPHQRVQHWVLMISFTILVVTGFPIKFADREWAAWLVDLVGGLHRVRLLHRWAGTLLLFGAAYHLVYVAIHTIQQKRSTGKSWWSVIMSLPMVMNAGDLRELYHLVRYLLFIDRTRPKAPRFSLEEKFEYFGVFWGTVLLGVTGILMWGNAWFTTFVPGRILTIAVIVHTFEAFLALLHVGVIHMIGVIFSPAVLPMSPAMFTGNTPAEEMAEAHAGMLEDAARKLSINVSGGTDHE